MFKPQGGSGGGAWELHVLHARSVEPRRHPWLHLCAQVRPPPSCCSQCGPHPVVLALHAQAVSLGNRLLITGGIIADASKWVVG